MITRTALMNPHYLARIKAAVVRAVVKANRPSVHGLGHAEVYSVRGRLSLEVVARRGAGFEVFDTDNHDVTATVLEALRAYHRLPAAPVLPRPVVEFDSGPMPTLNILLGAL